MIKLIKRIVSDIQKGENIDLYFFVTAAIVLAILNGLGLASQTLVASVTLALLGLLAAYSLSIRDRLSGINERLTGARNLLCDDFPPSLKNDISNSKELLIVGVSLARTLPTLYAQLEQKLKSGHQVKILLVEPHSDASKQSAIRIYRPTAEPTLSNRILEALSLACSLRSMAPKQVEIRTIDYPIALGGFAADLNSRDGVIYVEHYTYKTPDDSPRLVIFARSDPHWYEIYREQIQKLWDGGQDWQCNTQ